MNGTMLESKRAHATRYQSKILMNIRFPQKTLSFCGQSGSGSNRPEKRKTISLMLARGWPALFHDFDFFF
jgi:hypothetical protein